MKVELSPTDVLEVTHYAQIRDRVMEWQGVPHRKVNRRRTTEEITWLGRFGELVVARALEVPLPTFRARADAGYDLAWRGRTVQVKTTEYEPPILIFFTQGPGSFTADLAVLVVRHGDQGRIAGYIERERFNRRAYVRNFGYGDRLVVPAHDLWPFDILLAS